MSEGMGISASDLKNAMVPDHGRPAEENSGQRKDNDKGAQPRTSLGCLKSHRKAGVADTNELQGEQCVMEPDGQSGVSSCQSLEVMVRSLEFTTDLIYILKNHFGQCIGNFPYCPQRE